MRRECSCRNSQTGIGRGFRSATETVSSESGRFCSGGLRRRSHRESLAFDVSKIPWGGSAGRLAHRCFRRLALRAHFDSFSVPNETTERVGAGRGRRKRSISRSLRKRTGGWKSEAMMTQREASAVPRELLCSLIADSPSGQQRSALSWEHREVNGLISDYSSSASALETKDC